VRPEVLAEHVSKTLREVFMRRDKVYDQKIADLSGRLAALETRDARNTKAIGALQKTLQIFDETHGTSYSDLYDDRSSH